MSPTIMFNWFFKWRALREDRLKAYKLSCDKTIRGIGPGNLGITRNRPYYDTKYNRYSKQHRIRRILWKVLLIVVLIFLGWFLKESVDALRLYWSG